MAWIYSLPAWLFMSICVVGACALAVLALGLTRTRVARNDQITHNDVAGPILATIGTILAVMMSFMVVDVWQEYDAAAQTVQEEASALSDMHHLADALPAGPRHLIQERVDRYITVILTDEWPLMKKGEQSETAHALAYDMQRTVTSMKPSGPRDQIIQDKLMDYTGRFLDARRQRLSDNATGIPLVLWATMLLSAFITICFSFYFRVDRPGAQMIMVVALTAVVTSILVLIGELDYPFRGDVAIQPSAFVQVFNTVHNIGLHE